MRKILLMTVLLRVLAAAILILSPAFDSPEDLDGWDVARFQQIADAQGSPYVDFEVEYPPGSVVLISAVAAIDVGPNRLVTTHRILAAGSLAVDLLLALTLARRWSAQAAVAYLVLGSPLVFFGLVRFDLWACLLAVLAAAAITRNRPSTEPVEQAPARARLHASLTAFGAIALVAGAFIKLWPALLIVAFAAVGKRSVAVLSAAIGATLGVLWLLVSGGDALTQVLTLRGAEGWQIESVGGSLTALFSDSEVRLEANAYRIGTMNSAVITLSRVAAVTVSLALGWLGMKRTNDGRTNDPTTTVAIVMLGSVAALLVTAPLLSPQFLLWLSPWAAMLVREGFKPLTRPAGGSATTTAVQLTGLAIALTAIVLVAAGPPNLHHPVAAVALLVRDGFLLGVIGCCVVSLKSDAFPALN